MTQIRFDKTKTANRCKNIAIFEYRSDTSAIDCKMFLSHTVRFQIHRGLLFEFLELALQFAVLRGSRLKKIQTFFLF